MCQIPKLKQHTDRPQLQRNDPKQHGRWLLSPQRGKPDFLRITLKSSSCFACPPLLSVMTSAIASMGNIMIFGYTSDYCSLGKPSSGTAKDLQGPTKPARSITGRGTQIQTKHWKWEPSPGEDHTHSNSQTVSRLPVTKSLGPLK